MKNLTGIQKIVISTVILISLIGLVTAFFVGKDYYEHYTSRETEGLAFATSQTREIVSEINQEMLLQRSVAESISNRISSGEITYQQAEEQAHISFSENPRFLGIGIAFEPYVYTPDTRLHGIYLLHDANGDKKEVALESVYDYTNPAEPSAPWYYKAIGSPTGKWIGSYYGRVSDDLLIVYSAPFKSPGSDKISGVTVVAHSSTNTFKRFIQSSNLGQNGYVFLINEENKVAYHPDTQLIGLDIAELSGIMKEPRLIENVDKAGQGISDRFTGNNIAARGTTGWYFTQPLAAPGWKAVVIVDKDIIARDPADNIRQLINIYLTFSLFCLPITMLVFRVDKATTAGLMGFSVALGFLFIIGTLWTWYVVYSNPELNHQKVLTNYADVRHHLDLMEEKIQTVNAKSPEEIPTGIMIENMTMGSQSIKVSGYIWQIYPAGVPEDMIGMPQLTDQYGGMTSRESYRKQLGNKLLIGWFFTTEIQQRFDVSRYPLDQTIAKIQIEPAKLSEKYVLVPDLLDYDYTGPAYMPGVSTDLRVRGWSIQNSFYTFDDENYNANFGIFQKFQKDFLPNLTFNIRMTRDIISPVVAYCIVLYVVIIQVYGMSILKITDPFQVLSISAALFLVVAVTHNNLRDTLAANGVVYLEYYFILLYITILATSINAFLRAAEIKIPAFEYRNNLLFKILFWPGFLGIGLILTLYTFYPW